MMRSPFHPPSTRLDNIPVGQVRLCIRRVRIRERGDRRNVPVVEFAALCLVGESYETSLKVSGSPEGTKILTENPHR